MWYLEGFIDDERNVWRTVLDHFPFRVGRRPESDLALSSRQISSRHAELTLRDGTVWVEDQKSTNGTFVNGQRISEATPLQEGDLLRFARQELRLVSLAASGVSQASGAVAVDTEVLPDSPEEMAAELRRMMDRQDFIVHFQPVLDLQSGGVIGYEALGRGLLDGEVVPPDPLFDVAEIAGMEVELSHLLRVKALEEAFGLGGRPRLFLNTHPAELRQGSGPLLDAMARLLARVSDPWPLVLEVHESGVVDPGSLAGLGEGLEELGVYLAFDDFGTGQARLLELAEVEPRYLKFDKVWVRGLDRAAGMRLDMVRHLVAMVRRLGMETVAEGVESAAEAAACRSVGFHYAQGFHFARPGPASSF